MRASSLAAVMATLGWITSAQAAYVVNINQSGSDLTAIGFGSLIVSDLVRDFGVGADNGIFPSSNYFVIGKSSSEGTDNYTITLNGPTEFGAGFGGSLSSGAGPQVGFSFFGVSDLVVARGYVSGSPISSSGIVSNASFASFGLTPGAYVYSFGSGVNLDTFTIQVGPAVTTVPEPTSLMLLMLPLGLAGVAVACRRRPRHPRQILD